ncbi:MAG: hypothetical protein SPC84_02385, partial [Oscillospiraceae bacterium]|nr:hypothetical protein [Oscillospiraceae bacterium]
MFESPRERQKLRRKTQSNFMSRFVKLPSMIYVSLLGLLLACPVSPVKDIIVETTTPVAFLAPA